LERFGAAGKMAPVRGDFLGIVASNVAGNKIDWSLRRGVDYQARFDPGSGQVRSKVRVALHNQAPGAGLPDYIIGSANKPPLPKGTNLAYLSVYNLARAGVGEGLEVLERVKALDVEVTMAASPYPGEAALSAQVSRVPPLGSHGSVLSEWLQRAGLSTTA